MVTFREDDRKAALKLGESFEISLAENPTTGFRWQVLAEGEPVCQMVADDFRGGSAPGEPGIHRWQFQTVQAGAAEIRMDLQRPWARAKKPVKSFSLHVQVQR